METPHLLKQPHLIYMAQQWILTSCELGHKLFGDSFMTIKSHYMCHMPTIVYRNYSTMTDNSAYLFETWNGEIGKSVHGHQFNLQEFSKVYLQKVSYSFLVKNNVDKEKRDRQLRKCTNYVRNNTLLQIVQRNDNGTSLCKEYPKGQEYFSAPISSLDLQIFQIHKNSQTKEIIVRDDELTQHAVVFKDNNNFVVLPLRNCVEPTT